jgi:hypothetical protein
MHGKLKLLVTSLSLLLTMCTFYGPGGAIISPNELSCQNQTDFVFFERHQYAQCYYRCPDGTARLPKIPGKFTTSSPLYSASKEELNSRFCGMTLQSTPTQPSAAVSPTSTVFPTSSPKEQVSSSPTAASAVPQHPLLQGNVTMCDVGAKLINFRMVNPVPDLKGKVLKVQIAGQESICAINPVNTSLLTCTIPPSVTFPARIIVHLDGVVVNDFTYNGLGCAKIYAPLPTTAP